MQGRVIIANGGAVVFLPVDSPYDWQIFLDYIESNAARHAPLQLHAGRETVQIERDTAKPCAQCGRHPNALMFVADTIELCRRCAHQWILEACLAGPHKLRSADAQLQPTT
jgi:hypothetical protein